MGGGASSTKKNSSQTRPSQTESNSINQSYVASPISTRPILTVVTPRQNDADTPIGIPYTPTGDEAQVFRYYCPLCMLFYNKMNKTVCCQHYLCKQCSLDYLESKGISFNGNLADLQAYDMLLREIDCPHCCRKGFKLLPMQDNESARNYQQAKKQESTPLIVATNVACSISAPSPLRVGESFENMKRKMVPFKAISESQQGNNINEATNSSSNLFSAQVTPQSNRVGGIALTENSSMMSSDFDDLDFLYSPNVGTLSETNDTDNLGYSISISHDVLFKDLCVESESVNKVHQLASSLVLEFLNHASRVAALRL